MFKPLWVGVILPFSHCVVSQASPFAGGNGKGPAKSVWDEWSQCKESFAETFAPPKKAGPVSEHMACGVLHIPWPGTHQVPDSSDTGCGREPVAQGEQTSRTDADRSWRRSSLHLVSMWGMLGSQPWGKGSKGREWWGVFGIHQVRKLGCNAWEVSAHNKGSQEGNNCRVWELKADWKNAGLPPKGTIPCRQSCGHEFGGGHAYQVFSGQGTHCWSCSFFHFVEAAGNLHQELGIIPCWGHRGSFIC